MKRPVRRSCSLTLVLAMAGVAIGNAQANSGPPASTGDPANIQQIRSVITDYVKSVDDLDQSLARRVWSTGSEVSFIHPRGTERGLQQVLQNFYSKTMGTFSKRELLPDRAEIHVYGDAAWSDFTWTFHATVKDGGPNITTQGRETQIYRKEEGIWRIVHVHYSGMPETGALKGF
jgi:ketosteroid isomerase-like protein